MKHIRILLLAAALASPLFLKSKEVKFSWDPYTAAEGLSSNMVYRLYKSTNVVDASAWKVIGSVTNKNNITVDIGTGDAVVICAVTVSNKLFESDFSVPLSLPAKPVWQGSLSYEVQPK